jgi:hypothetical protein
MENISRQDKLLQLIMDLGGEGDRQTINPKIPDYWDLREDDKEIELPQKRPYYWHRADSQCQGLKLKGFLELAGGIWKVTSEGKIYLIKKGLYKETEVAKNRISQQESINRKKKLLQLLFENQDKVCDKVLINDLFPEYYPISDNERELDAQGHPKYWKTIAGMLSFMKGDLVNNPRSGVWELTKKGLKEINPPLPEKEFYKPFAEWMSQNLLCDTKVCSNKRIKSRGQNANPDVIGTNNNQEKIAIEIKSSENSRNIFSGLLQALSYKLFSHQSYLVVPKTVDDSSRLVLLAKRSGIGLIEFDNTSSSNPHFTIVVEALKNEPDKDYYEAFLEALK